MQAKEYRTIDKSSWPRGPWDSELDKVQWRDEATGLPCLAVRNQMGCWCGYVGVPAGHPLHGKEYGDVDHDISVHGGLTFSDKCQPTDDESTGICHVADPGEDDVWWFGFDCAHSGDLCPRTHDFMRELPSILPPDKYRSLDYVRDECKSLAAQLKV